MKRLAVVLLFCCGAYAQISSTNQQWRTNGAGTLANRPVTCSPNRDVYICNGAGCGTNGEYHYCTSLNTYTVPGGGAPTTRTINTTSPLTGGGDLSADRTFACPTCIVALVNPAVGLLHVPGGSQTATSSAVNLAGGANEISNTLPVGNGGTGLASGTSGGIPGYTAAGTIASSVALTVNVLPKGGGAGATPTNSSITDTGTIIQTAENVLLGAVGGTPDSQLEVRSTTGGVATPFPGTTTLFHTASANAINPLWVNDAFGGVPGIRFRQAGGTIASKSALGNGAQIFTIGYSGFGTTVYGTNTMFRGLTTQAWTDTANGSRAEIFTIPNGTTSATNDFIFDQDGSFTSPGTVTAPRFISPNVALTDNGTTIATDASLSNNFRIGALTANVTLSNPTNLTDGQIITWEVIQNAAAAKTLAFGTNFGFGAEITACTISAGLSSHSFITGRYNSTTTKVYLTGCLSGY